MRTEKTIEKLIGGIVARGGETGIDHAPSQGCSRSRTEWRGLELADRGRSEGRVVYLLRAEGWRYYSRRFGSRPAALAYLAGRDDSGYWAARVPGTCATVAEAVEWLTPADVARARAAGRRVLRQGDVYAIETTARADGAGDPGTHEWYRRVRVLLGGSGDGHRHAPVVIPFPCRFVRQRAYQMGRGGRGRGAD